MTRSNRILVILSICFLIVLWTGGCNKTTKKDPEVITQVAKRPEASTEEMAQAVEKASVYLRKTQKADSDYRAVVEILAPYREVREAPVRIFEFLGESHLYLAEFQQAEHALAEGLRRDLYSEKIRELLSNLNYVQGRLSLEKRKYEGAREFFGKAIFNTPNDIKLIDSIASLYSKEGQRLATIEKWADCAKVLKDAVELKVSRPDNDKQLARALLEIGEPKDSLEAANRYLVLHGNDTDTMLVKARSYYSLERVPSAIKIAQQVLQINPGNLEARKLLGTIGKAPSGDWIAIERAKEEKNWPLALRLLERSLKNVTDPNSPHVQKLYEDLALVCAELNDYTKALMYVDMALAAAPDNIELSLQKATILRRGQRLADAKKVLEKLLVNHSDNPQVRLAMAEYWIQLKLPGNAIPHLEVLVSAQEDTVPREYLLRALEQVGACYARMKQLDKAEEVWLMLTNMDGGKTRVLYNLGWLYNRQHRYGRAIEYYERACQSAALTDDNFGFYLYALASAYRQNGQHKHYQETLEKVIQVCPLDNPYRRRAYKDLKTLGWGAADSSATPPIPGSAEELIKKADETAQWGELDKAQALYQQVLTKEPQAKAELLAAALRGVGILELTRRQYARAVALLIQSLELAPRDKEAIVHLGEAYESLQLYEVAAKTYRQVLGRRGDGGQQVRFQYARALRGARQFDKAVMALDAVVNEGPTTLAGEQAKRVIKEIEPQFFKQELTQGELDARARQKARSLREVAVALAEVGLRDKARNYIKRARAVGGEDDVETLIAEAKLLDQEGKASESLNILSQALAKSPKDTRVLLMQATLLFKQRRQNEAEQILQQILALDGTDFAAAAALSDIYQASGRKAEARTVLEKLLQEGVSVQDAEKVREKLRLLSTL